MDGKEAVVSMENLRRFRHNVMNVNSISAFESIRGGVNENCKDVYFVRFVGICDTLVTDVSRMDADMAGRMRAGHVIYKRVLRLPFGCGPDALLEYEKYYDLWTRRQKASVSTRVLPGCAEYAALLGEGLEKILKIYADRKAVNASMEKNFVIKMLYWHDFLLEDALRQWEFGRSVKIVLSNLVKQQEYLFACLLTFLGCDVLLLQCEADISAGEEELGLSEKVALGPFGKVNLPEFDRAAVLTGKERTASVKPISIQRPERAVKEASGRRLQREAAKPVSIQRPEKAAKPVSIQRPREAAGRAEKSFEQLAQLASSVVMIGIHDRSGKMIGTGSGIMIGPNGYILTNSHVASGGHSYSIRIEEEETVYSTDELIKYHSVLDLAVLRIDRRLRPLPLYTGAQKLLRGQKVVAIGSPLGLFNSVSDGIISGFRKIDGVDMIQFTAPTSHGSSGGALLNMYGEVIGISTAGFDNAQNINLAVGYESILPFIKGFT